MALNARALWLQTRPLPATPGEMGVAPPISRRGPNYKTKPIEPATPHDLARPKSA